MNMFDFEICIDGILKDYNDRRYDNLRECIKYASLAGIEDSIAKDKAVDITVFENLKPLFKYQICYLE